MRARVLLEDIVEDDLEDKILDDIVDDDLQDKVGVNVYCDVTTMMLKVADGVML